MRDDHDPSTARSVQKARTDFGRRDRTRFESTHETIPVSREDIVCPVAERTRDCAKHGHQAPSAIQVPRRPNESLGSHVHAPVRAILGDFDQNQRVDAPKTRVSCERPGGEVTTERGEPEYTSTIDPEQHSHRAVAEAAHAVVKQDGSRVAGHAMRRWDR